MSKVKNVFFIILYSNEVLQVRQVSSPERKASRVKPLLRSTDVVPWRCATFILSGRSSKNSIVLKLRPVIDLIAVKCLVFPGVFALL